MHILPTRSHIKQCTAACPAGVNLIGRQAEGPEHEARLHALEEEYPDQPRHGESGVEEG